MKYLLVPALLMALVLPGVGVRAETDTPPPPPKEDRPGFYQNAIDKAELRKEELEKRDALFQENHEERKELFKENQGERHDLFRENKEERHALFGSSTPEERKALFKENMEERRALFDENKGERRDLFKEQWEERKAWFASSTDAWKSNLEEKVKERVAQHADRVGNLFGAMLERLSGIADRIEGRIEELKADGVDTSEAEALLEEADTAIADAGDAVDTFAAALAEALESETPRDALSEVSDEKEAAKTALRKAHEALKKAAEALPKPQVKEPTND